MQALGWGLREFCRETGVDPSFFSKVLSGKRSPPSEEAVLRRIAKALELDAPNLIVASGRIPSEWRSLWEDPEIFGAVHRLAAGEPFSSPAVSARIKRAEMESAESQKKSPASTISRGWKSSWSREPKRPAGVARKAPKSFGEELL